MICPNCRSQVTEGTSFCPNCGTSLTSQQVQQPDINQNTTTELVQPVEHNQNTNLSPKKPIVLIIVIAVFALTAIFGISKIMKKDTTPESNNTQIEDNTNTEVEDNTENTTTTTVDPDIDLSYTADGAFLMAIGDIFTIADRGTVVTGTIERGTIKVNEEIQVIGLNHKIITTTVTGIEKVGKKLESAEAGDNVSIALKDVKRDDIEQGQVLAKPNSIKAATKFEATLQTLTKEEGGRHTPFFTNYRPQFYFRTADITGVISLPEGVEMVTPGDKVDLTVELTTSVAMEVGTKFSIREGGRTVGNGTVTKIY